MDSVVSGLGSRATNSTEPYAPASLRAASCFAFLSFFLIAGHAVRSSLWVARRLYIPASLLGGLLSLAVFVPLRIDKGVADIVDNDLLAGAEEVPSFLISIVFACLFIGEPMPSAGRVWQESGPQLVYGQILAWGQYALPSLLVAAVLVPAMGVNQLIAPVVALGFEGGHGSAAGVRDSFAELGYPRGADLALCAATIGMLAGVLCGTVAVNWAVAKGHLTTVQPFDASFTGVFPVGSRPISGRQTTAVEGVDSFALHTAIVGLALMFGYAVKRALIAIEDTSSFLTEYHFFSAFPLFPFCMFGGILIQLIADRVYRNNPAMNPIDRNTIERIGGLALEYTVVSAIMTMSFDGLEDDVAAFCILVAVVLLWHGFCYLVLARHILPDYWAVRAVAEMGQSMGVTSTGLLLLRMADPENKSPALRAFSYKQLIHEPIVGGGLWTACVLPFTASAGIWPVVGASWGAVVFWLSIYMFYFRPRYKRLRPQADNLAPPLDQSQMPLLSSSQPTNTSPARAVYEGSRPHKTSASSDRNSADADSGGGESKV